MSLLERLRSLWPLGSGERSESPEPPGESRIEPPEEVLGVSVEPAGVHLSEFDDPRTFDKTNLDIHCGGCDGIYSNYWGWYDHASEEFDTLNEARDWATVLIPTNEEIERIMANDVGGASIDVPFSGKPSPKDPGEK
jgi:hypothetical protein